MYYFFLKKIYPILLFFFLNNIHLLLFICIKFSFTYDTMCCLSFLLFTLQIQLLLFKAKLLNWKMLKISVFFFLFFFFCFFYGFVPLLTIDKFSTVLSDIPDLKNQLSSAYKIGYHFDLQYYDAEVAEYLDFSDVSCVVCCVYRSLCFQSNNLEFFYNICLVFERFLHVFTMLYSFESNCWAFIEFWIFLNFFFFFFLRLFLFSFLFVLLCCVCCDW